MVTEVFDKDRNERIFTTYYRNFGLPGDRYTGGCSFPCDPHGVVEASKLPPMARDNYERCLAEVFAGNMQDFGTEKIEHVERCCSCGSGQVPDQQYDGHGIYLCLTCPKCHKEKMAGYRPDIMEAYECDEPIYED